MRWAFKVLVGISFVSAWLAWPQAWQSLRNREPLEIGLGDYLASGGGEQWLHLKGVYIDGARRVRTEMTKGGQTLGSSYMYFPLRVGPDDTTPVKLFLRPRHYSDGGPTIVLIGRDGVAPDSQESNSPLLQDVSGTIAVGMNMSSDLEKILHGGDLPVAEEVWVLEQDATPVPFGWAIVLFLLPPGMLALGLGGLRRGRRKSVAAPPPAGAA